MGKETSEILRELRKKKNVTQGDIAKLLGFSTTAYQNYERGINEPSNKSLCILADFYGVTTDYLLGREPHTDPIRLLLTQGDTTPAALEKQFEALPEEGKAIVMAVIRALKETRRARQTKEIRPTFWMKQHQNKASAGFGYDLSSDDEWYDIEVIETPEAIRADFAVEVEGDSMEPDYHNGDIVLIMLDPDVPVGAVGLFLVEDKGYIKERGTDCLISRNPEYPDIEGVAQCIGLVIGIAEVVE